MIRATRNFRRISTILSLTAAVAALALPAFAGSSIRPVLPPTGDVSWVVSDSPRYLGGGAWEQGFYFTPEMQGAAALQLDLRWMGDGAVDARFTTGAAAAAAAKNADGDGIGNGRFRVLVAGVNRLAIPAGEVFRVVYHAAGSDRAAGFQVIEAMAVDGDGILLSEGSGRRASSAGQTPADLDPHVDLVFENMTVLPGQTQKETVQIGSQDNARPAAVQLDIRFDPSALVFRSVDLGTAASIAGKQVKGSLVSSSLLRIIVQGFNTTPIPDGELVRIGWQALGSVPRGTVSTLDCSGSIVTDGLGFLLPTTCHGGPVIYIGNQRCDVNLDGRVDVVDIQAAINKITKLSGPNVDVNCNLLENVQDVQQITDGALGLDCPTPGANDCQ